MYLYATEMVSEYYSRIDLQDKSVLTIIGSGDQIINAYFFGAKSVTGFDINKRAVLFADLKINAIKSLSFKEFLLFFGDRFDNASFEFSLYQKVRENLKEESINFFDGLYKEMEGKDFLNSSYFRQRASIVTLPSEVNAYLRDEESYNKVKNILALKTPELIAADIQEIPSILEKRTFDLINLSNVPNYFVGRNEGRVENFISFLKEYSKLLVNEGLLIFYSYSPVIYETKTVPPASSEETLKEIEATGVFKVEQKYFKAITGGQEDKVSILTKI